MKKLFIAASAILLLSGTLQAQSEKGNTTTQHQNGTHASKGKKFEKMKANLGLSEDQATKIKATRAGLHEKIKAIRENKNLSESQKKEQVKAISKQQKESMKAILTPAQLEKMKDAKKSKATVPGK